MDRQPTHASWATQVRTRFPGPEELFGAAAQLEDLMAHPGWAVLTGLVTDRRNALVAQLGSADVLDHAKYVAKSNSIRTFDEALQAAAVVVHIAHEVRREEEQEIKRQVAAGQEASGG